MSLNTSVVNYLSQDVSLSLVNKRVRISVLEDISGKENKETINFIRYEENQRKVSKIIHW